MDFEDLLKFAAENGNVTIIDSTGQSRVLATGDPDVHDLVANANQFLWDGVIRGRREMEELLSQRERGLHPGCEECDRLERELILSRERDRRENRLDSRYELLALGAFKDHRTSH